MGVSNAIRYDPLLVRYLASELDGLLRDRPCAAAPYFAADRLALLPLDRGEALEMDLHPRRGWIRIVPWESDGYPSDAICTGVSAPIDERRLVIGIEAADRFRAGTLRLEVELHTNQWNVLLVSGEDERIHSALWSRRAGGRPLSPGAVYRPPPGAPRVGAAPLDEGEAREAWRRDIEAVPDAERERALLRHFAWTGTVNAAAILGGEGEDERFACWWRLRSLPPGRPVVLVAGRARQPYPLPLPGVEHEPVASLLEGMACAAEAGVGEVSESVGDERLPLARLRLESERRRLARLEAEGGREEEAQALRERADLLLSHLHEVPRGVEEITLTGWDGEPVVLRIDPSAPPAETADAWYAEARKRMRAAERLPALVAAAREVVERWEGAVAAASVGELPGWAVRELERGSAAAAGGTAAAGSGLPYRMYRSSGGLEIRVGRGAKANDQLTFGHSSPNDVWLHARSVPGSHVILRWNDPNASPPARDLEEAARLAAFHSRARSSAYVPVDWTRRKHVRKPRGAPAGAVIPQRVKTLFVEPEG